MISNDRIPESVRFNPKHILCDLADSISNSADFSVLAVLGTDDEGRGYILDSSVRGRFLISELVKQIAKLNESVKPSSIIIENSRGAEKLKSAIELASRDLGTPFINLIFQQVDNTKGAKIARISRLEKRLYDRRLFFSSSITFREELMEELTTFPHGRFDDAADAVAMSEQVLTDERPKPVNSRAQSDAETIFRNKDYNEMIFGSPEDSIVDNPLLPLPGTDLEPGTGGDDVWNPFGIPVSNSNKGGVCNSRMVLSSSQR